MSKSDSGKVRAYRPVTATVTVTFESNIDNDVLRSSSWWRDTLAKKMRSTQGIRSMDVNVSRRDISISRQHS